MSSSLKYKKIYIDTKFMTPDSVSTSDFNIELPETLYFDNNSSVFYIDDVCIPHSWYSITEGLNDKLYLIIGSNPLSGSNNQYIITLDKGNYTPGDLATELKTKMNTATQSLATNIFDCTYDFKSNRLQITAVQGSALSPTFGFYILTPKDLQTRMNGVFSLQYNIKNPMDCNEIIGNFEGYSSFVGKNAVWSGGQVNLQPIRNIYMHSSALGNLSNIGPDGSQTVIKKIPVTSSFNNYIFDQTVMFNDYNSCSGQTLKKLDFQFKTARGEIIPLSGLNVSFSIVFSRAHPDA